MVLLAVGEEHVDRLIDQSGPTIPSGIIRDLLVDQSRDQRGPQIEVPCFGAPIQGQQLLGVGQGTDCRRIRLWRWLESGERALEQELVSGRIADTELDEAAYIACEQGSRVVTVNRFGHPVGELRGGLAEHGVVDGLLRLEVGVNRWRGDGGLARQIPEGQTCEAYFAYQRPG